MACMTEKQLQEHHEDIEAGISMIVACDHYHQIEAKNLKLQELWVTVELCCNPPESCNDPVILKRFMAECVKKAAEYEAM